MEQVKVSLKFPKEERLHHRSLVEGLFRVGKSFYEFPFRVTWRILSHDELQKNFRNKVPEKIGPLQIMVTVPKKKRRKATDRVLLRRRIREAYRLNRHALRSMVEDNPDIGTLSVALVYINEHNLQYSDIEMKIKSLLVKLQNRITQ